ncbi:MAG TPA: (2Fe-2S)-binding protein [Pseudonocardiaceae bacterium]|jgi:carbon-monoxide dehydrogenase small subunit|nr:(2Fe-2S)-binding protein [Pseudonocardiaceae bacterium]
MRVELTVNGERATLDVEPRRTLADALRENLGLTGTHLGCEHGVCGACTVLVDDQPVRACLMFAVQAEGSTVTTVEGLAAPDGSLHPLQQAFCDHHGLQCGFCTPGMLMSALALLRREPNPGRDRIREELSGNICRCTGYTGIIDAVDAAAGQDEMT